MEKTWLGRKMLLDVTQDESWEQFRDTLIEHGSDEGTARSIWERVQAESMGQVDPVSGGDSDRDFLDVAAVLDAEDEGPEFPVVDELTLVWMRMEPRPEVMLGMFHATE